jgi:hypothetical protein
MKTVVKNNTAIVMLAAFSFVFLISDCSNRSQSYISKSAYAEDEPESSGFIILSLNISKNKDRFSVSITNSTAVKTEKKIEVQKTDKWNENDFICFILDERKRIRDTIHIMQPLNPRYEYPGDDGTIGSAIIELPQADVLIRFPYSTKMKYLRVGKVENDSRLKILNTLTIPVNN